MGSSPEGATGANLQPAVDTALEENFSIFKTQGQPSASAQGPDPATEGSGQGDGNTFPDGSTQPSSQQAPAQEPDFTEVEEESTADEQAGPVLSEAEQQAMLARAEALKLEGNTLYGQGQYEEATQKYSEAVDEAPPSASKQRAVYLANISACDVARKQFKEAVQACNAALEEDPTYVKAYMRRGVAYRELDDLDHALADANKVLELDPGNSWATRTAKELGPVVAERHEKLKDEMLGKLKDLGNTILGKFGMSLDQFKADKDPNTGGYSIRFQQ